MSAYSVVIPAFNAAATIAETIRSVLEQSVPPERIIVADDGSSDDTVAVVAGIAGPIEVVAEPHVGPGAASTVGLARVSTEFVAMVDADDLWLPRKIEAQLAFIAGSELAGCFCHIATFRGEPGSADMEGATPGWSRSTLFMRSAVAHAAGPIIDPPGLRGEMIDWFARIREAGHRLEMMPDVLALRRIHPNSLTYARTESGTRAYIEVARAALLRRRQGAGKQGQ